MKSMKRLALAGMLLGMSMAVSADMHTSNKNGMMNTGMMKKQSKAPLSDMTTEQQHKIKGIVNSMRFEMKQTMDALRKGRKEMSSFITAKKFDDARAKSYADQQGQLYAKMVYMRMKTRHEIYKVMTPAQQAEIQARMKQNEAQMMNRMNKMKKMGQ